MCGAVLSVFLPLPPRPIEAPFAVLEASNLNDAKLEY